MNTDSSAIVTNNWLQADTFCLPQNMIVRPHIIINSLSTNLSPEKPHSVTDPELIGFRQVDIKQESLLGDMPTQNYDQIIIIADYNQTVLFDLQDNELKSLRTLMQLSSHILWITAGSPISGQKPEHAMVSGLARCLRAEDVSLDLVTVDFDTVATTVEQMTHSIMIFAERQVQADSTMDKEYLIHNGIVFVSRLAPIDDFCETQEPSVNQSGFSQFDGRSALKAVPPFEKLSFHNQDQELEALGITDAKVKILATGITPAYGSDSVASGFSSVSGHDICGIVTAIGSEVSHLMVGDKVVGFSSDSFSTIQRIPAMLLCPLKENEVVETMASLPTALCTAIYGLQELAHVEEGETVVILDDTGTAGIAAVQFCRSVNANFIVISKNENFYASLIEAGFKNDQVLLFKGDDISHEIQRRTRGKGVDIILSQNSAEDTFQACLSTLAPFARLIFIGGADAQPALSKSLSKGGDLSVFVFDILHLRQNKPQTVARLLRQSVQLYRDGTIFHTIPVHSWSLSDVDDAVTRFSNNIISGPCVVSYENHPKIRITKSPSPLHFDPNAIYLLVGCLGGVGRSLTSWMVDCGARHLAFMTRSGCKQPAAARLVSETKARGVEVMVLKGDVASSVDVESAVRAITQHRQLRGVVNAAMVLNDGLFQSMDLKSWRNTIDPKVRGSYNLHQAVKEHDLDFFVLLSSTSGTLGTPGQSNYAAANAYQDALALQRRAMGLPAVSLILPMVLGVGYVADNPEIEHSLLRKGIYGIHEDELLAGFEVAMRPQPKGVCDTSNAHLILGFEPERLARSITQTETTDAFWLDDPRFSTILAMVKRGNNTSEASVASSNAGSIVAEIRSARSSRSDVIQTIESILCQRLARLLSFGAGEISPGVARSVASYGLDSMIGAEFRNWLFKEFDVDVSYQRLLASDFTIKDLAVEMYERAFEDEAKS
ncbi:MAG: hypothetical protein Q9219_006458 [cf. Caloplaca sp. 3 TL-2023]